MTRQGQQGWHDRPLIGAPSDSDADRRSARQPRHHALGASGSVAAARRLSMMMATRGNAERRQTGQEQRIGLGFGDRRRDGEEAANLSA